MLQNMSYLTKFIIIFIPIFLTAISANFSVQSSDPTFWYGAVILAPLFLAIIISLFWQILSSKRKKKDTEIQKQNILVRRIMSYITDAMVVVTLQVITFTLVSFVFGFIVATLPEPEIIPTTPAYPTFDNIPELDKFREQSELPEITKQDSQPTLTEGITELAFLVFLLATVVSAAAYFSISYITGATIGMRVGQIKFVSAKVSDKLSRSLVASMLINPIIAFPFFFLPYYIADIISIITSQGQKNLLDRMSGIWVELKEE